MLADVEFIPDIFFKHLSIETNEVCFMCGNHIFSNVLSNV